MKKNNVLLTARLSCDVSIFLLFCNLISSIGYICLFLLQVLPLTFLLLLISFSLNSTELVHLSSCLNVSYCLIYSLFSHNRITCFAAYCAWPFMGAAPADFFCLILILSMNCLFFTIFKYHNKLVP